MNSCFVSINPSSVLPIFARPTCVRLVCWRLESEFFRSHVTSPRINQGLPKQKVELDRVAPGCKSGLVRWVHVRVPIIIYWRYAGEALKDSGFRPENSGIRQLAPCLDNNQDSALTTGEAGIRIREIDSPCSPVWFTT